jgi:hypothetical protein
MELGLVRGTGMSATDEYLNARKEFEQHAARVSQLRARLKSFRDTLESPPGVALAQVPADWPTRDDLLRIVGEANAAFDRMQSAWTRVPAEYQEHVTPPPTSLKV